MKPEGEPAEEEGKIGRMMESILVIDADQECCEALVECLAGEGYKADTTGDKETGVRMCLGGEYALILIDVMLPGEEGKYSVLRDIRCRASAPIMVLGDGSAVRDRIAALELGGEDFICKPFKPRELIARIRAVLRRVKREGTYEIPPQNSSWVRVGDIEMDAGGHRVFQSGKEIELTPVEFRILETLLRNAGGAVSRDELMVMSRGRALSAFDRSIDVHVSRLRRKLGDPAAGGGRIITIRGEGYFCTLGSLPVTVEAGAYEQRSAPDCFEEG